MASPPEQGRIKQVRYEENSIRISDSMLHNVLPPQIKNIYSQNKLILGCEYCICAKIINSYLLSQRYHYMEKLKYQIHNAKNRRSGEISNGIFQKYNNYVVPHGHHIYQTSSDMDILKMCHINHPNMHCHTVNLCCIVVQNVHVLISRVRNQSSISQKHFLQYIFMYITQSSAVEWMVNIHQKKRNFSDFVQVFQTLHRM